MAQKNRPDPTPEKSERKGRKSHKKQQQSTRTRTRENGEREGKRERVVVADKGREGCNGVEERVEAWEMKVRVKKIWRGGGESRRWNWKWSRRGRGSLPGGESRRAAGNASGRPMLHCSINISLPSHTLAVQRVAGLVISVVYKFSSSRIRAARSVGFFIIFLVNFDLPWFRYYEGTTVHTDDSRFQLLCLRCSRSKCPGI